MFTTGSGQETHHNLSGELTMRNVLNKKYYSGLSKRKNNMGTSTIIGPERLPD